MSNRSLTAEQGRQAFVSTISGSPRRKKSLCKRELSANYARESNLLHNPKNSRTEDSFLDDLTINAFDENIHLDSMPKDDTTYSDVAVAKRIFTQKEDQIIIDEVERQKRQPDFVKIDYHKVASKVGNCINTQCWQRYNKTLIARHKKGTWSHDEDRELIGLIKGSANKPVWKHIAQKMSTMRNPKQCRERWKNHLDPSINKGPFTQDEDNLLLMLAQKYNKSWAKIAREMPNRTEGLVKTRYKKLTDGTKSKRSTKKHSAQNWMARNTPDTSPSIPVLEPVPIPDPIQPSPATVALTKSISQINLENPQDGVVPRDSSDLFNSDFLNVPLNPSFPIVTGQDSMQRQPSNPLLPQFQRQLSFGLTEMLSTDFTGLTRADSGEKPSGMNSVKGPLTKGFSLPDGMQLFDNAPIQNLSDTLNVPANNWNAFFNQAYFQPPAQR